MTRSELQAVLERLTPEQHRWLAGLPAPESALMVEAMHIFAGTLVESETAAYKPSQVAA